MFAGFLCSLEADTLRGCCLLLTSIEKMFPVTGLRVMASECRVTSQSNRLFTSDGVNSRLEGNE